jgi:ATP-dependent Clp protease ATP-binding subunit ClpC
MMSDKFDKFTKRARRVLTYAQEEAQRLNHNYIGTEHILLGLTREEESIAAHVLRERVQDDWRTGEADHEHH